MSRKYMKAFLAGCVATLAGIGTAAAEDIDFSGQRITMIIPYQEGAGSTIHGRLFATAMEEQLPGHPSIIVRNIDGGGSVRGINQFHMDAKPDGLTFAATATGTFFQYILKNPAVQYPLDQFKPFLASPFGLLVYSRVDNIDSSDPLDHVRHMQQNPPVYGGEGPATGDLPVLLSLELLGIKPKPIFGMSNTEARSGFERGEITVNFDNMASWAQAVEPLVSSGVALPLFTFGFEENGQIVRDPMLPDVLTFPEVYEKIHGKPLTGIEYSIWKSLFNVRVMGSKALVLPAGTPDEIVQVFTNAVDAALKSPRLNGPQAELVIGKYKQSTGKDAQEVFKGGLAMGEPEKDWLRRWLLERYEVKL